MDVALTISGAQDGHSVLKAKFLTPDGRVIGEQEAEIHDNAAQLAFSSGSTATLECGGTESLYAAPFLGWGSLSGNALVCGRLRLRAA